MLRGRDGDRIKACGPLGNAGAGVRIGGFGRYRGSLVARNAGGTLQVINVLGIQGYVKGVVASEVPTSWPEQALRAQAVVARSYELATARSAFDHYADTRSQVYGGRTGGDQGDQQGRRRDREPGRHLSRQAGGHLLLLVLRRADRELGVRVRSGDAGPLPAVGQRPLRRRLPRAPMDGAALRRADGDRAQGLFEGRLERIEVLEQGDSPKVVRARVVGSAGSTAISGVTLRARLELRSTWARFVHR